MFRLQSRLRDILKEQGRSQKWLVEKTGANKSTISAAVKGENYPSLPLAIKIAKTLGIPVEEIWFEEQ
jgi:putative transcriptional regulator